jgi:hypothetical protein
MSSLEHTLGWELSLTVLGVVSIVHMLYVAIDYHGVAKWKRYRARVDSKTYQLLTSLMEETTR